MPEGKISWFSHKLGIGFIRMDEGEKVLFRTSVVEHGDCARVHDGQRVKFDIVEPRNGISLTARNVKISHLPL